MNKYELQEKLSSILKELVIKDFKDESKGLREYLVSEFIATKHQQDMAIEYLTKYSDVPPTYDAEKNIWKLFEEVAKTGIEEPQIKYDPDYSRAYAFQDGVGRYKTPPWDR